MKGARLSKLLTPILGDRQYSEAIKKGGCDKQHKVKGGFMH